MPILEFQCALGHTTEKLFRSFVAAAGATFIQCGECENEAELIASVPYAAHLHGSPEGYYKPSPSKRYSTKLVSQKDGNKHSAG